MAENKDIRRKGEHLQNEDHNDMNTNRERNQEPVREKEHAQEDGNVSYNEEDRQGYGYGEATDDEWSPGRNSGGRGGYSGKTKKS